MCTVVDSRLWHCPFMVAIGYETRHARRRQKEGGGRWQERVGALMKRELNVISIQSNPSFRLNPALTGEEGIVLRALVTGQTDRQVCKDLRMDPTTYLRMMRDIREKIGTRDNISLIAWAKQQIKDGDQRMDGRDRYALPA